MKFKELIKRFRESKLTAAAMLAAIYTILSTFGIVTVGQEEADKLIEAVLTILAIIGIFNNPTDKEKF